MNRSLSFLKPLERKIRNLFKHPFSREFRIFFIFLLISCFFWVLQSLQEIREFSFRVPVVYNVGVHGYSVTNDLPSFVTATIRDKGINLYYYYRHRKDLTVTLNLKDFYVKQDIGYIPSLIVETQLKRNLLSTSQLIRINPDNIVVYYARKKVSNIPVILKSKLTFAAQHILADTPDIHPSAIEIYAPSGLLHTVKNVQTEILRMEELNDTVLTTVRLKPIPGVRFSVNTVEVRLCVEEFTERSYDVPVEGQHFPIGTNLLAFPPTVKVTFFVGLSQYKTLKAGDFRVAVDYNDWVHATNSRSKVKVIQSLANVSNIRVVPEFIECLTEKQR